MDRDKETEKDAQRCQALFHRARLLSGMHRQELLQEIGGEDPRMKSRLEALLAADKKAEEFLDSPVRPRSEEEIPGYRLLEVIGEGGFGTVWRAEQLEPIQRNVAIKVLQAGAGSDDFLTRFEAERQALALMDHPGIATIFDAGKTSLDRPWFAMELVEGSSIVDYCDTQKLSINERLALFEKTCQAVQHAHQRGVIHRDLKPSNVLIAEQGERAVPKVIDFGIAKAIDGRLGEHSIHTRARQILGTPRYMSPEQSESSLDIDTRTDVYSLGVLLCELLVGTTPLGPKTTDRSLAEILRAISEEDPPRPSVWMRDNNEHAREIATLRRSNPNALAKILRSELDWIVLKALERDKNERYTSAAAFAQDIRRFLDGQPVDARPPRWQYQLGKFVQRNRTVVAATAVILLSLLAGLIVSVIALRHAGRQEVIARDALANAREQLWESELSRAREALLTKRPGRRSSLLGALSNAAQIRMSDELPRQALAGHALADLEQIRTEQMGLQYSPNGLDRFDRYAVTPELGVILVRSIDGKQQLATLRGPTLDAYDMMFSPDGQYLAAKFEGPGGNRRRLVWHVDSQRVLLDEPGVPQPISAVFDRGQGREPRWLAFPGLDGGIQVRSLPDLRVIKTLGPGVHWWALASSPDGDRLVATSMEDQILQSWSLNDGATHLKMKTPTPFRCIAWSANGNLLAAGGSDRRAYLADAETGQNTTILSGHQGQVTKVFFGADDSVLATYSWDGTGRLWNTDTGEFLLGPIPAEVVGFKGGTLVTKVDQEFSVWSFGPMEGLTAHRAQQRFGNSARVVADRTGRTLVSGGANGVLVWDTERRSKPLQLATEPVIGLHWIDSASAIIAVFENDARYWKITPTQGSFEVEESRTIWSDSEEIRGSGLLGQDSVLGLVVRGAVLLVDLDSGIVLRRFDDLKGASAPLSSNATQRLLAVGSWRGEAAHLIDLETGQTIREFSGESVTLRIDASGSKIAATTADSIELFAGPDWESVFRKSRTNSNGVAGFLMFSPDGSKLVAQHSLKSIRLYQARDGKTLATLDNTFRQGLVDATFSGDGRRLVGLTAERTLFVWDLNQIDLFLHSMEVGSIE